MFAPFGPAPLVGLVATRPLVADEEVLVTYGHDYWLGQAKLPIPPYTAAVLLQGA